MDGGTVVTSPTSSSTNGALEPANRGIVFCADLSERVRSN
jgi:hypothetical protein